jgi:acetate---CoA ligase (ADP-forming)
VQTMFPRTPASAEMRRSGVPVFESIERAAEVCGRLAEHGARGPGGVPPLPPPAAPVDLGVGELHPTAHSSVAADDPDATARFSVAAGDSYGAARELLAAGGVPFVGARTVAGAAEAVAAAAELGYPVVLKALGLLHKSDSGGVALGLRDEAAVAAAAADMERRLAPAAFTVERLAPLADGVELLIGARWDARFGPVALAGLGGLFTEILRDVAVALAPVDESRAREMLLSLRAAPLLQGARGRPPLDVAAAAAAFAALSRVAAEHPELAAIEVNPLLVLPDGALGLDARLELAAGAVGAAR